MSGHQPLSERFSELHRSDSFDEAATERYKIATRDYKSIAVQVEHGAITGTFTAHASEKKTPSVANDDDWYTITGIDLDNPAGSAGGDEDSMIDVPHRWIMLKYVHASGTGDLDIWVTLKA